MSRFALLNLQFGVASFDYVCVRFLRVSGFVQQVGQRDASTIGCFEAWFLSRFGGFAKVQ